MKIIKGSNESRLLYHCLLLCVFSPILSESRRNTERHSGLRYRKPHCANRRLFNVQFVNIGQSMGQKYKLFYLLKSKAIKSHQQPPLPTFLDSFPDFPPFFLICLSLETTHYFTSLHIISFFYFFSFNMTFRFTENPL